jgi:hypothetical protein
VGDDDDIGTDWIVGEVDGISTVGSSDSDDANDAPLADVTIANELLSVRSSPLCTLFLHARSLVLRVAT